MTPEIGQAILNFLARADIKGSEAEAMMVCRNAIQEAVKAAQEGAKDDDN